MLPCLALVRKAVYRLHAQRQVAGHLLKGTVGPRLMIWSKAMNMVKPIISKTLDNLIPFVERRTYKFAAILGDLKHKEDVYLACLNYGPSTELYFTNEHQAQWLRDNYSSLVPPPSQPGHNPSDHTLATVFEYNYYTNLAFKICYLGWLRRKVNTVTILREAPGSSS